MVEVMAVCSKTEVEAHLCLSFPFKELNRP